MRTQLLSLAFSAIATPAFAGPLEVTTRMLGSTRVAAADGTVAIRRIAPARVVPGDAVTFVVAWRNTGARAIADVVLANPVPAAVAYRGPAGDGPVPDVSVDGSHFAPLASLRIAGADGSRVAVAADVVAVRWRLASLPPGASGEFAFDAVVR